MPAMLPLTYAFKVTLAGPPIAIVGGKHLTVTMQTQDQTNWCWAAVAASIADYYGSNVKTQCQIVTDMLPGAATARCCTDGSSAQCNKPYQLLKSLGDVGHLAATGSEPKPLKPEIVQSEIGAGRPVGIQIFWRDTGGRHFIAVTGYAESSVDVRDPFYGPTTTPYLKLRDDYLGRGTWTRSYRTT
jgi:hypothetical protein